MRRARLERLRSSCSTLFPSAETVAYLPETCRLGLARIEAHYFVNDIFLEDNAR